MSWNYRVVRQRGNHGGTPWEMLGIHEVYYNKKRKPNGVTQNPVAVSTDEGLDELRGVLTQMLEALDKPILDYEDFG